MPEAQQRPKSSGTFILIIVVVIGLVFGFAYHLRGKAQKPADFSDAASISSGVVIGAVSRSAQTTAETTLQTFIDNLRNQNYSQALGMTTNTFPTPHTANGLKSFAQNPAFLPIFSGSLKFEPAHIGSHGQKLILRASFQSGAKPYRTVCTFEKNKNDWLISGLLNPVPPSAPPVLQGGGLSAAPHH